MGEGGGWRDCFTPFSYSKVSVWLCVETRKSFVRFDCFFYFERRGAKVKRNPLFPYLLF